MIVFIPVTALVIVMQINYYYYYYYYNYRRLKKCVLSFLRKLVRDEISFMSDGSAFQVRGSWPGKNQSNNELKIS